MSLHSPSARRLAALAMLGLGALLAARWLFDLRWITQVLPSTAQMGLVAPLLMVSAGVCAWWLPQPREGSFLAELGVTLGIAMLVLFPTLMLIEHLGGIALGVDFARPDTAPSQDTPHPGRLSPNACVGFLLAGIGFAIGRHSSRHRSRWLLPLSLGVAAIGLAGLVGHFLNLEPLFRLAQANRLVPPTALALVMAGLALWLIREELTRSQSRSIEMIEHRIARRTVAVVTLVALGGGITGFAVIRNSFERFMMDSMRLSATTNAAALANALEAALWYPKTAATRLSVRNALRRLRDTPGDEEARELLREVGENLLSAGLLSARFYDTRGEEVAAAGASMTAAAITSDALAGEGTSRLVWSGGYVLQAENPVTDGSHVIGTVRTEQRLHLVDQLLRDIRMANDSSDALLCSRAAGQAACAPTRLYAAPFTIPMYGPDGKPSLPINRALLGEAGVGIVRDLRGVPVVAAYTPIKDYGLGLVVKTDVDTLYEPLKNRAEILLLALAGLVVLGTYAVRSQVRPLLASVGHEQRRSATSERRVRAITDNLPVLIAYIDNRERLQFANETMRTWMGLDPAEVVGRPLREVIGDTLYEQREPYLRRALQGERVEFELVSRAQEVDRHLQNIYIPEIEADGSVAGLYTLSTDVTAMKLVEQHLEEQARVDSLTGLPNRRRFEEKLLEAMARSRRLKRPMALLFLDLDHFKEINDTHGHGVGDAVLREFAARLTASVRVTDTVARLAGDEFVIILEVLNHREEAMMIAAKIVERMRDPVACAGQTLRLSTSVGIALFDGATQSAEALVAAADAALYEAKRAGRNTYAAAAPA